MSYVTITNRRAETLRLRLGPYTATVNFDPTTFEIRTIETDLPAIKPLIKKYAYEQVTWAGRARIVDSAHFNYNLFPLVPPPSVTASNPAAAQDYEAIDIDIVEGPGYAIRESSSLEAITFWWIEENNDPREGLPFEVSVIINGNQTKSTGTTVIGYESATSMQLAPLVLRMFALPYEWCSTGRSVIDFAVIGAPFSGRVVFDANERSIVDITLNQHPVPKFETRRRYGEIWWRTRSVVMKTIKFTQNNEPIDIPFDAKGGVACIRSGNIKRDLFFDGPGYAFATSPTLGAITVWWITTGTVGDVEVAMGDFKVDAGLTQMVAYPSLIGTETSDLKVCVLQIPVVRLNSVLKAKHEVPAVVG